MNQCVRASEVKFISCFLFIFPSIPIEIERVSACEKPTFGIRALRSTCGDAAEDWRGELVINRRYAEIRESGDEF